MMPGLGQGKHQGSLEYLVVAESEEVLEAQQESVKRTQKAT